MNRVPRRVIARERSRRWYWRAARRCLNASDTDKQENVLMKRHLVFGLAAAASLALAASAHADPGGVKAGVLTCNVSSGWGLIFGSSKELNCTFENGSGREDDYVGTINKYGVDV